MVPTSLKVLGILGIIYSALGILGAPCGIFLMYHPLTPSPMMDAIVQDRVYIGWVLGMGTLGFFLAVLLLASSIGCLKAKRWARAGMNTYAIAHVVTTIGGTIFNIVYAMPKMKDALATVPGPGLSPAAFEITQIIGAILGLLFSAAIVTTILVIVNRKIAVDAFNGIFPADPTNFPVDYPPSPLP